MSASEQKLRKIIRRLIKESFNSRQPAEFSKLKNYSKNKQVNVFDDLHNPENSALRDEFFKPIDDSYMAALGQQNADIKSPKDLMNPSKNDYSEFLAWDIDEDPHPDVIRGMKPKSGYMKLSLSATDGSPAAKVFAKKDTVDRLKDGQHFAEMSGPAAGIAMGAGVKAVLDPNEVQALLGPNKKIQWFGVHPYDQGHPGFQDINSEREAAGARRKSSPDYRPDEDKLRTPGMYDGWYVRMLGGVPHAKMIFGEIK